ncbi:XRE family transcriptional regulator [Paenibacillus melissococcoides]|uniref:XRE family transcriptional regulator n=1 Tax=Paenibacillus melissococcoides TaxID=2912268 RepID=A0ABN8U8A8_9BACL|nr:MULTISPECIES: XRE family transcriptional regulator [Paenibacillus]MEB9895104.1 XRE family transcriptional regulator [Bacillus cereus]CAH8247401.1 XRE family transcriptional regulator [Paenibacillus melissococcoides]CAH8705255.1 XRE family transcriptional regulator [Paenibacillus melissococcoides]CAH8708477.1 XRE family transcriptional regulator [Paenibacillus melissococcoides]GIO79417.1 hypothetical protein J6TS7_30270 [Paenibacillus dendritiformis]
MQVNKTVEYQRKVLAKNIKMLLDKRGKTQTDMARELGIAETTVSSWMNCERYPRLDKIQLMADYFNVRRSDITEEINDAVQQFEVAQYPYYPVSISAGLPIEVIPITPSATQTITLPNSLMGKWAGSKNVYIMRVNGESMNKVIPHSSLIAVKSVELSSLNSGDIVVYSNGHEYSVKRFYNDEINERVIFRPDSTDLSFTDHTVSYEEAKNLKIHGKVVVYVVELG